MLCAAPVAWAQERSGEPPPLPQPPGVEVQARGPVHEAYAQPDQIDPQAPAEIAPKEPSPPVPEVPPDQKPEGANVEWIPGYWQWDTDSNQFLWVSGVYRDVPPGQRWVQGYWTQSDNGWLWVHGFWAPADQQQLDYLPPPPAPREEQPPPSPGDDHFYIPGCWIFQNTQYVWRPGYWWQAQPDWVYNPPQYQWTPGGCVFTDGYWDYPLSNRGLLFAPVAFTQPLWNNPDWYFQPQYVVGPTPLLNALWVRPAWRSYYFGNYYTPAFARAGFRPWHDYGARFHDPLFSFYRWRNRSNPQWAANLGTLYRDRVAGRAPLPPNTLRQQVALARGGNRGSFAVLAPLNSANRLPGMNVRLARVNAAEVRQLRTNAQRVHAVVAERQRVETSNARVLARSPRNVAADRRSLTSLRLPAHPNAGRPGTVNRAPIRVGQGAVARTPASQRQGNVNGRLTRNSTVNRKERTPPRLSGNPNATRTGSVSRVEPRSGQGALTRPARNVTAPTPNRVNPNPARNVNGGANRNPALANRAKAANPRPPASSAPRARTPAVTPRPKPAAVNRQPQVRQPAPRVQQQRAQPAPRTTGNQRRVPPGVRPTPPPLPPARMPPAQHPASKGRNSNQHH
jgi:hypothetical protein